MKTTIEDRSAMRARLSDITGEGIVALIDDIDSLESLVHRQAELLERSRKFHRNGVSTDDLERWLSDLEELA